MHNKKVLQTAIKELDKRKAPPAPKDIITDPAGQWKYPGLPTRIPSNEITMQGVDYPVLGVPDKGEPTMMHPGGYYTFPEADYVDEYPQMKKGGGLKSKKYTKNIMGKSYLFEEGPLFKKKKESKKRIFHPNAKYYKKGGEPARAYYDDSRDAWVYEDGTVGPNGPAYLENGGYVEAELTPEEIQEYAKGGYIVEDISVPSLNEFPDGGVSKKPKKLRKEVKPFVTSNLKEYAKRKQAYDDSLTLYNAGLKEYDLVKKNKRGATFKDPLYEKEAYAAYKRLGYPEGYSIDTKSSDNLNVRGVMYEKPVQPVYKKSNQPKPKVHQYPKKYKPVVNTIPKTVPEGKAIVGYEEVQQLNPKTGEVTTVKNPVYTDLEKTIPTLHPTMVNPELKKFVYPETKSENADVMPVYDETAIESGIPDPGGHWEDQYSRYIDWDGNSIDFNGIRFRKPGHGGDLIKKGKRHYIHYPSIEKRLDAWIEPDKLPEEEYRVGGEYMELDLTPEEIEEYAKGGFIIEDISIPPLN